MNEHAHLIRISTFHPAEGRRQELISVCEEAAEKARGVEGCYGVQVCSVREEPESVAVISRWENPAGLERMLAMFDRDQLAPLLRDQPRTYHLTPL